MVIHISHRYIYIYSIYNIELKLSVFMMTGSHPGFLLDTGHVWRTSQDLFLRVHNRNSTRGKPWVNRMDLRAFMYQKGIAKVSLRVSLGDWREFGKKKGTIPSLAQEELKKDMNSATGTQKSPNFRKESCKMHADNCKKSQKQWAGCR